MMHLACTCGQRQAALRACVAIEHVIEALRQHVADMVAADIARRAPHAKGPPSTVASPLL